MKKIENGDLVYVDLGQHRRSCVQSGVRPCLVIGSYYASDALNVLPLTKNITKKYNPIHIRINRDDVKGYLANDSLILVEQITTVDRRTVMGKLGRVSGQSSIMEQVRDMLQRRFCFDIYAGASVEQTRDGGEQMPAADQPKVKQSEGRQS